MSVSNPQAAVSRKERLLWFVLFLVGLALTRVAHDLSRMFAVGTGIRSVLGWLPNLLAALSTPFLFLLWYGLLRQSYSQVKFRSWCIFAALFCAAGLLIWEVCQKWVRGGTFDYSDILATLAGCAVWLLFSSLFIRA